MATLNSLGEMAWCAGEYERAETLYREALAMGQAIGDSVFVATVVQNLGYVALHKGDEARAESLFRESLAVRLEHDDRGVALACLVGLAQVRQARHCPAAAARLLGAVEAQLDATHTRLDPTDRLEADHLTDNLHAELDPATLKTALAEGSTLTLEQVVAYTLAEPG
jgi:Tfp pilus assembly protein PilF